MFQMNMHGIQSDRQAWDQNTSKTYCDLSTNSWMSWLMPNSILDTMSEKWNVSWWSEIFLNYELPLSSGQKWLISDILVNLNRRYLKTVSVWKYIHLQIFKHWKQYYFSYQYMGNPWQVLVILHWYWLEGKSQPYQKCGAVWT